VNLTSAHEYFQELGAPIVDCLSPEDIRSVQPSVGKPPGTLLGVAHHDHFVAAAPKLRQTCAVLFTTLVFEETWHPTTTDKNGNSVRATSRPIKKDSKRQLSYTVFRDQVKPIPDGKSSYI
jgi:hypothetical protein